MWLLPFVDRVAGLAVHSYYNLTIAGGSIPRTGPLLVVANHPNSLHDPAMVAAVVRRPLRFLAKEPLFRDRAVGWLIRGAGSIPVYRVQDDPSLVSRNDEAFRAAHEALRAGAAVGIFPEGISHDFPSLAPLKTGAARIALGAAKLHGRTFPIVPIGISLRDKARFRSEALALVGPPIDWDDLAPWNNGGEAVRQLTLRIEHGLRGQTLNLASWEDAPLIEWASAIYSAHHGLPSNPMARVAAEREAVRILTEERKAGGTEWYGVANAVRRHGRALRSIGLRPADLQHGAVGRMVWRSILRRAALSIGIGLFGVLGSVLFYPPYRLTGAIVARLDLTPDLRSTYRTLGGALLFGIWILILAGIGGTLGGWRVGFAVLLLLPLLAVITRVFFDQWKRASRTLKRLLLLRRKPRLRAKFLARQAGIATRLEELRMRRVTRAPTGPTL